MQWYHILLIILLVSLGIPDIVSAECRGRSGGRILRRRSARVRYSPSYVYAPAKVPSTTPPPPIVTEIKEELFVSTKAAEISWDAVPANAKILDVPQW